jgi:hypothetical protein
MRPQSRSNQRCRANDLHEAAFPLRSLSLFHSVPWRPCPFLRIGSLHGGTVQGSETKVPIKLAANLANSPNGPRAIPRRALSRAFRAGRTSACDWHKADDVTRRTRRRCLRHIGHSAAGLTWTIHVCVATRFLWHYLRCVRLPCAVGTVSY